MKNYKREADRLFSLLIRQSDADDNGLVRCCTCSKPMHWRQAHLGHFIPRQHQSTRFDRQNVGVQCVNCNTFHEGEQYKFSKYLDAKYGVGTSERIHTKAMISHHRKQGEYKFLCDEFLEELKNRNFVTR